MELEKLVHLVGFVIRICHDARSSACQTPFKYSYIIILCYLKNKIIKIRHHNILRMTDLDSTDIRAMNFSMEAHRNLSLLLL